MKRGQLGQLLRGVVGAVLCLPLVLYGRSQSQRPPRSDLQQALFQGVTYERLSRDAPRPHVIHIVTIDLTVPGVKLFVTPGDSETLPQPDGPTTETSARTVTEFLQEFDVQVAINAGYFYLFREKTPWNYYPHSGDRVNVVGQGISAGQPYSPPQSDWPVLCFDLAHRVQILEAGTCPPGTVGAIAGNVILPRQGADASDPNRPYGRTIVATDDAGETLWLIVVDGKQPDYSEGITLTEIAPLLTELGADIALNLDGGGSTTLVAGFPAQVKVINAPIHTKWPMRERPVATHLGIYAEPLSE